MGFLKDIVKNFQDNRTQRVEARQETKAIAYQNGIDPNAAWAGAASSIAASAGSTLSNIYGGGMKPGMSADELDATYGGNKTGGDYFIWILCGLFAFLMFKKR